MTEVVSLDKIWFCLLPMVKERDKVMEELNDFYTKHEGKSRVGRFLIRNTDGM